MRLISIPHITRRPGLVLPVPILVVVAAVLIGTSGLQASGASSDAPSVPDRGGQPRHTARTVTTSEGSTFIPRRGPRAEHEDPAREHSSPRGGTVRSTAGTLIGRDRAAGCDR